MSKISKTSSANIIFQDYPDPDVIRVDNTYYMVSTTMHFTPGCVILRSYNLVNWEIASYVYEELEKTPGQKLDNSKGIYGQGMWAATIRYHKNKFYIAFVANDTHKTYLYTSDKIEGPWEKTNIQGFYHDMSLLFDDDEKVYCISGNTQIRLIELEKDLSGPKKDGINKIIIEDNKNEVILGYEGSHIYKINGKYYIFLIHWPKGKMRTQSCYVSNKIEGPYTGKDVLCSDYNNWQSGVAQGGIIDTPDGSWYGILFQDHGALGRIPIIVPVTFKNDFPVFGNNNNVQETITLQDYNPQYKYASLYSSSFLNANKTLNKNWQWNHIPNLEHVQIQENELTIATCNLSKNPCLTKNTLTQRPFTEHCQAFVTLDFSDLKDGDVAGLCALEGDYAFIGIQHKETSYNLIYAERETPVEPYKIGSVDTEFPKILNQKKIENTKSITLLLKFDLSKSIQKAYFYYCDTENNEPILFGTKKLSFTLDQFVGVRFALFNFATKTLRGKANFKNFKYQLL